MSYVRVARLFPAIGLISISFIATACDSGEVSGLSGNAGASQYIPNRSLTPPAHAADLPCGDSDSAHLCIALKYAAYDDGSGLAVASQAQANQNVKGVNSVWSQCHIQFFIENYSSFDPRDHALNYQPATMDELETVRGRLSDTKTMLVTTTGNWAGALGAETANGWTKLPAVGPFGVVIEKSVSTSAGLIAHELGHYLNLDHQQDQFNVMDPVVYHNSLNLTDSQCAMARATALSFWGAMLR